MRKRVLWGHHVSEYQEMFDLPDNFHTLDLLEYGCGASAVNAELHALQRVVSVDPLFVFDKIDLEHKVLALFEERKHQVLKEPEQFNFLSYGGMEQFLATRRAGISTFFNDYEKGRSEKRYQPLPLDTLPFADFNFDLALSSHYLFAGSHEQSVAFHLNAIKEMARVAKEVRIFPLIEREGKPSALLGPILLGLQQTHFGVEVREVRCALYPSGNAMLRVWAEACEMS